MQTMIARIQLILFIVIGNTFSFGAFASLQQDTPVPMTVVEGLNNNTVHNMARDHKGYIWFSTDMGLSRYDGFHFRNFPYITSANPSEPSAYALPQAISNFYPNKEGILYLQLAQGGMSCFDSNKEIYLPVRFNRPDEAKVVNGIYLADQYALYIATDKGLYTAEVKRSQTERSDTMQVILSGAPLIKGAINFLCGDDKGNLFFCVNSKTIIHYSMGTRQIQEVGTEGKSNTPVTALYANEGHLWIGRKFDDISFYDYKRKTLRTLTDTREGATRLSDTYATGFTSIDEKTFYVSTWAGLYCITFANKYICDVDYTVRHLTQVDRVDRSSLEKKMTSLLWDESQNILWAGTFGGGAIKLSFNEDAYNQITQQWGSDINGIVEDSKGYIWLASERKGVWRSTSNVLAPTSLFTPWTKGGINPSEGYQIYKDKNGGIWLGDEHAGLIFMDPLTGESQYYKLAPENAKAFTGNALRFCLDSRERLWIVTTQGVLLFDNKTGEMTRVIKPEGTITDLTAIAEDKEGDIWVGTNAGVKRVNVQADKITLTGEYEQSAGLTPCSVSSIYINSNNQIFITYQDKILRIDGRQKEKVEAVFTLNNDLSSGRIFCMIDDLNGNTWAGSNSGIMTIRNDRTSFYNYSASGHYNSVCRLHDGRLLWSGSWGLISFDPLIVKSHQSQKKLVLSDLKVDGKTVAVGEEINGQVILATGPSSQQSFRFSAANKDFRFYFSDMQYGMMQRKLAYRISADEEWEIGSIENGIHYNNLKSGKYTLQVKLVYPDASEGEILEVPIVIQEYWWKTTWAILCYILLAGGIGAIIYYFLLEKEKRKMLRMNHEASLHEEMGHIKQEQIANEEKSVVQNIVATRFLEELRTPLSLVISPLREVLQEKDLSKGLSTKMLVAYRNSIGMLNACDQLLSIYSYAPKEQLELAPYSILKLSDALVFSINEFLRVHPIDFQYEKKIKKDLEVWIDKKALELTLQNMLSNAFIHTNRSGAVALILQEMIEDGVQYCSITVIDNAKTEVRPLEELKTGIADFNRIPSAEVELGYGMMRRIMKQHHGTMILENLKDGGTRQQIKFPIDKAIFEKDENITFTNPEKQDDIKLHEGYSIKLPDLEEEELQNQNEQISSATDDTRKTLLIIEDNKDIRLYLKTLFEKEYNVLQAINGLEGVAMAKREMPNLIISDIMMPLKDGYECCREIKEGMETCHIPVILLTAKVEDDDIIKGLEIGADDYILKPFTPKILKVKVKNLIEGRIHLKQMYTKLLVAPPEDSNATEAQVKSTEIEDPFISTVVKIIEENMQEPDFNVKKLAADLKMSQPTLYRKIKQSTDFTIIELIRGVRMRKAAILLKKKQYPVQEVVEMVGYNDIPTFRKHFVDTYGTTPSTFADSGATEIDLFV